MTPSSVTEPGDAFSATGQGWNPISARLATAHRLALLGWFVVPVAATVVLAFVAPAIAAVVVGAVLMVVFVWAWWLIGRRVRAYGYLERPEDLLVVSGIMFRRLVVVPYGRMQLVDLRAGPLERVLGLSTVQLHTAAATTDATIPGLPPQEAAGLRDRLAARGEQRSAGL